MFSLPKIDMLVGATANNEMMSLLDVFSSYNQIKMNPADKVKTSFITKHGTYCHKVMPFGLINAGATNQQLMNKMFANQLGKSMEVFSDDILKSKEFHRHFSHLEKNFPNIGSI